MALTEEQREKRREGISASEVGAILGLSPYAGPFDIWQEKIEPEDQEPATPAQKAGQELEGYIARNVGRLMDVAVEVHQQTVQAQHDPLVLATPDYLMPPDQGLVECKKRHQGATSEWGEPLTDEVPPYIFHQAHWQLHGLREELSRPVCFVGLQTGLEIGDCEVYRVAYDEQLGELVADEMHAWWDRHVVEEDPPEPTGKDEELDSVYGQETETMLESTEEIDAEVEALRELEEEVEDLKDDIQARKNRLQMIIGEDYGITGDWGEIICPEVNRQDISRKKLVQALIQEFDLPGDKVRAIKDSLKTHTRYRQFRTYFDEEGD